MFESKNSTQFCNIYESDCSDMFESTNSTRFEHIYKSDCSDMLCQNFWYIRPFWYIISELLICLNRKILLVWGTFTNQTVLIYYIRISDMFESTNSNHFCNIYESDCSDILYQNYRYVWIEKFYSFSAHSWIRLFWYIISIFLICLNQKIRLIFATFLNQTVLIYIRISDMFESTNSTRFGHIYKSDCCDIWYQNFWCVKSKNSTHFCNIYESDRPFWYVISEFQTCLNRKILLIFGTFMN